MADSFQSALHEKIECEGPSSFLRKAIRAFLNRIGFSTILPRLPKNEIFILFSPHVKASLKIFQKSAMSGSNIQLPATPRIQIHYSGTVEEERSDTSTQSQQTTAISSIQLRPRGANDIPALRSYVSASSNPECASLRDLFNRLNLGMDITDCLSDPDVRRCINDQYEGETALCRAAALDNIDAVLQLLGAGACPGVANAKGRTPLLSAACADQIVSEDRIEIIKCLLARPEVDLKQADNDNCNIVHLAAGSGCPEIIELVLKELEAQGDSEEQIREFIDARDAKGLTPLFHAICMDTEDYIEVVHLLVERGADLDASSDSMSNVLHHTVQHNSLGMLDTLLEIGEEDKGFLEARDEHGRTPLICAATGKQIAMVRAFLGADVDVIGTLLEVIQNNNVAALDSLHFAIVQEHQEEGVGISSTDPLWKIFNNPYVAMVLQEMVRRTGCSLPVFESMATHNSPTGPCDPVMISDTKAVIFLPQIMLQNGPTCKLTALATLDFYYAMAYCIPNIPLRKNRSGFYLPQLNPYHATALGTSILEVAKRYGWTTVGEVMRLDYLESTARAIGYDVKTLSPGSLEEFRSQIVEHIGKGIPLLSFYPFTLGREGGGRPGWPRRIDDENTSVREHAALIVGIDTETDTITLAQTGRVDAGIPLADFYWSMGILPTEKPVEIFERTNEARFLSLENRLWYKKYNQLMPDEIKQLTHEDRARHKISTEPPAGSGFRYKVLAITPDLSHERWAAQAGNA